MYNTKSKPYGKLWTLGDCDVSLNKCRFIGCNKYSTLVGDVDKGGGYVMSGGKGYTKISVFSAQFRCEPKIALKILLRN